MGLEEYIGAYGLERNSYQKSGALVHHKSKKALQLLLKYSTQGKVKYLQAIRDDIKLLGYEDFQVTLKKGYFRCTITEGNAIIVNSNISFAELKILEFCHNEHIFIVSSKLYFQLAEKLTLQTNIFISSYIQRFFDPKSNAYIFGRFHRYLICLLIYMISCLGAFFPNFVSLCGNIIYFTQAAFKFFIFKRMASVASKNKGLIIDYDELPIYTILIPLYREAAKVDSMVRNVQNLNYPKSKLDVKIILEQDDIQTIKAVSILSLPAYFHIIKVPNHGAKTKPKACNFASQYALGEYIVIFDAEDTPDPDQLLLAVGKFQMLPSNYACLQAKLRICHKPYDLLGSLFKIEYDLWFSYLLSGLAKLDFPVPLGGTSNHFRLSHLRKVGLWDPYNVTEDADLGIRLNIQGFKVDILDSYTKEEAHISLTSWVKQRIRWIKGFIMTFFVYLLKDKNQQSYRDRAATVTFIGFSILSFLICPLIIISCFKASLVFPIQVLNYINVIIYLEFFWISAAFIFKVLKSGNNYVDVLSVICFPIYFILHSFAAYCALIEVVLAPFRWNKTDHNI